MVKLLIVHKVYFCRFTSADFPVGVIGRNVLICGVYYFSLPVIVNGLYPRILLRQNIHYMHLQPSPPPVEDVPTLQITWRLRLCDGLGFNWLYCQQRIYAIYLSHLENHRILYILVRCQKRISPKAPYRGLHLDAVHCGDEGGCDTSNIASSPHITSADRHVQSIMDKHACAKLGRTRHL